jgi:regulator of PEP synthase PpsR (kinase-PPPase family)
LPIYILSGGVGSSGEQLARTVLAQFRGAEVSLHVFSKVVHKARAREIVDQALEQEALIIHTFVDPKLRQYVQQYAEKKGIVAFDLVGPFIDELAQRLQKEPQGTPGLYRQLHKSYFDRIDAMDYMLNHDDGKHPEGWRDAEIVLVGASRVGKTPLSLYLSVLGWKVANIPMVPGIPPHNAFLELDKRYVVGLTINPGELIEHRQHRQSRLGLVNTESDYINPSKVYEEIEAVEAFLRRNGLPIIDVSGKPIETSADEVIRLIKRKSKLTKKDEDGN